MNHDKGLTITELMVSIALLGLVIASAASFFMYQSAYGRSASTMKRTRENITLAMSMIRHDVLHSGYGVGDRPGLAMWMRDKSLSDNVYKELYVNYGTFIRSELTTSFIDVFDDYAYFVPSSSNSQTTISDWSDITFHSFEADSLLLEDADPINLVKLENGIVEAGQPMTSGTAYAPGISYTYDSSKKALLRNGEVILGGEPYFSVEDFSVRARFYDAATTSDFWSPVSTSTIFDFDQQDINQLRAIEITTFYKMKTAEGENALEKSPLYQKTIQVAPRSIVLQQQ